MKKYEILEKLNCLDLDKNKYIIISGASLVLQNVIDETSDIDLACPIDYYEDINWPIKIGAYNLEIKYYDVFEISNNLYSEDIIYIEGYPCLSLEGCLKIKEELNRDKDKLVIKKLKELIKTNKS
jgi:hypothetical protein